MTEGLLTVQDGGRRLVADDLGLGGGHDPAAPVPPLIGGKHADPVRVHATQVGPDHEVRGELGDRRRRAPPVEDGDEERLQGGGRDDEGAVTHRRKTPFSWVNGAARERPGSPGNAGGPGLRPSRASTDERIRSYTYGSTVPAA